MPETATLPKRNLKPRSATIAKLDTRLPRCVRRRLPCTQVSPLRCHSRPSPYQCADRTVLRRPYGLAIGLSITGQSSAGGAPTTIANAKSRPDRCPIGFATVGGTRCKKSLSMMDLSLPIVDPDIGDLMSENGSIVGHRLDEVTDRPKDLLGNSESAYCSGRSWTDATPSSESEHDEVVCPVEDPTIKATNVVCRMLMLNAWRRRRAETAQLGQQVENLHLQIEFLRRLLLVENDRVGRLNGELHREKSQLEEVTRERDAVKSEKGKLEGELKRVEEVSQERSLIVRNLKNELLTVQDQLKALDAQMAKDREKILKLREDKRILLDKVSASEAMIRELGAQAEKAESTVEDLQTRLAAQTALAESTQKQLQHVSRELEATQAEKRSLEERLKSSESNNAALSLRVVDLSAKFTELEAALQRVESEYNSTLTTLNELREQLLGQEGSWNNRILQIAGNIMRTSIVRFFVFLSNIALLL